MIEILAWLGNLHLMACVVMGEVGPVTCLTGLCVGVNVGAVVVGGISYFCICKR